MNTKIIPIHQIGFPNCNEFIIPDDDSVRLLYEITKELDYTTLHKVYSANGRKSSILPETLFRIIIYGYMEGIYSSRDLAKSCKRDINFRWLLQNQTPPSHNTIARFRSVRLTNCIEDLFNQLVLRLADKKEIEFKNLFVDGTKIEANANRYTFVWKKSIEKNQNKLMISLKEMLVKIIDEFKFDFEITESTIITSRVIEDILVLLEKEQESKKIDFVSGKGKRKTPLQKYVEDLKIYLIRINKYEEYNNTFNGRNSFSKTDTDATFMHMKEDHMKNGQLKAGYNVQIGVEGEYIVGVDISSERSDQLTFIPFLERLENNLKIKYEVVTADAGYESEENYVYLEENNQVSMIKPQNYEKEKTRKFKSDISKKENMTYNKELDFYVCASGKKLLFKGTTIRKSKSGYKSTVSIYECEDCSQCLLKAKCTKAQGNKQIHVSKTFTRLRQISLENIKSEKGIILRMNRSIQVEGAFGVIKEDLDFRRFLLRGSVKVRTEFLIMAFGYNVNKLHNKTIKKRNGEMLHQPKAS